MHPPSHPPFSQTHFEDKPLNAQSDGCMVTKLFSADVTEMSATAGDDLKRLKTQVTHGGTRMLQRKCPQRHQTNIPLLIKVETK